MAIHIITSAWQNFQKVKKQDFTAKIMEAIAMTKLIKDFNPKDVTRLLWIRDNTHEDIRRSIYEHDR